MSGKGTYELKPEYKIYQIESDSVQLRPAQTPDNICEFIKIKIKTQLSSESSKEEETANSTKSGREEEEIIIANNLEAVSDREKENIEVRNLQSSCEEDVENIEENNSEPSSEEEEDKIEPEITQNTLTFNSIIERARYLYNSKLIKFVKTVKNEYSYYNVSNEKNDVYLVKIDHKHKKKMFVIACPKQHACIYLQHNYFWVKI